jgi:hypothetical protein
VNVLFLFVHMLLSPYKLDDDNRMEVSQTQSVVRVSGVHRDAVCLLHRVCCAQTASLIMLSVTTTLLAPMDVPLTTLNAAVGSC